MGTTVVLFVSTVVLAFAAVKGGSVALQSYNRRIEEARATTDLLS